MKTKNQNQYSKIDIYKSVDLIVQTTNTCSKNCPGCCNNFLKLCTTNQELDLNIYKRHLSKLKKGSLVALRGGEPTMINDWFEKFVAPAIQRKLKIIVETNGFFIGKNNYWETLEKMTDQNIFVRVSFDKMHLLEFDENQAKLEFNKIWLFISDAEKRNINFNFYSVGMNQKQIREWLRETRLEQFLSKFHPLKYYKIISRVRLKGKYLRADGKIFNRIK